jgi:hypothetical protein
MPGVVHSRRRRCSKDQSTRKELPVLITILVILAIIALLIFIFRSRL